METNNIPIIKPKKFKKKILIAVIITIIIIFVIINFYNAYIPSIRGNNSTTKPSTKILEYENEDQMTIAIDKIYDAVMCIEVYNNRQSLISSGTGFVYKQDNNYGYIITNKHVIEEGITIKGLLSNSKTIDLTLISSDSLLDIAVLRMNKADVLKVATLGNSSSMKLGNTVFAVGSPMGSAYAGTITKGIVAGKDRLVESGSNGNIVKVIQTDAAINPGNSGGPLVNLSGEVIGINSLKLVDTNIEGMGFAIPIEDISQYLSKLERNETIVRPYLGIKILDITDTYYLQQYNIQVDSSITSGVVIQYVEPNKSAFKAGLIKGDIIIKIDSNSINNVSDFRYHLYKYTIGQKITITYLRNNIQKTVEITLSAS